MEIGGDTGIGRKLMKHYQSSYHCVHRYYWGSEMVWNTPQGCASKGVRELGYLSSNPCSSLVDSCSWGVSSPALPACPACRLRMLLQPEQGLIQGLQWEAARRNGEWGVNMSGTLTGCVVALNYITCTLWYPMFVLSVCRYTYTCVCSTHIHIYVHTYIWVYKCLCEWKETKKCK